jgi:hypothetical protein
MKCTESQRTHCRIYGHQIAVYKMSSHELIPLKKIILEKEIGPDLEEKFPHLTWNLMVHYRFHKRLLLVPVLCQMHPVHALTSSHLCRCLPCAVFRSGFPTTNTGWGIQIKQFCIMRFLTASVLCPYIQLSILCLKTLSPCPSFSVRDQVIEPCQTGILKFAVTEQWEYDRF